MMSTLHDPMTRELAAHLGAWELRTFAPEDRAYFSMRGFLHAQLWHPASQTSILTPSRLTIGHYELVRGELVIAAAAWSEVAQTADLHGVAVPSAAEMRSVERWFVQPADTGAGRLLRAWWSGAAMH